jgi:hypothetical protein
MPERDKNETNNLAYFAFPFLSPVCLVKIENV